MNKAQLKLVRESFSYKPLYTSLLGKLSRGKTIYMIEGTWSGYSSSQSRICHREYTSLEKKANEVRELREIIYTDGTSLYLTVKTIKSKDELLPQKLSYEDLIRKCINQKVNRVADLT